MQSYANFLRYGSPPFDPDSGGPFDLDSENELSGEEQDGDGVWHNYVWRNGFDLVHEVAPLRAGKSAARQQREAKAALVAAAAVTSSARAVRASIARISRPRGLALICAAPHVMLAGSSGQRARWGGGGAPAR
jgi:hypothetical protein